MIRQLEPHHTYSILLADSVVPRQNHTPVVVAATQEGVQFEFWLLRGLEFFDADGEPVEPEGYLSNAEFFALQSMLGGVDEHGNTIERTLPMERSEIYALVMSMREQS